MPGSRPGLLAERLGLLVQLPVRRPLVGRLAWVWLLLSARLLRRLFIHHALPSPPRMPCPRFKDTANTERVCRK